MPRAPLTSPTFGDRWPLLPALCGPADSMSGEIKQAFQAVRFLPAGSANPFPQQQDVAALCRACPMLADCRDAAFACRVATALARGPVATSVRCTLVGSAARSMAQRQAACAPLRCLLHVWPHVQTAVALQAHPSVRPPSSLGCLLPQRQERPGCCTQGTLCRSSTLSWLPHAAMAATSCCTQACMQHSTMPAVRTDRCMRRRLLCLQSCWLCCICTIGLGPEAIAMPSLYACSVRLFCNQEASPLQVRFMCSEDAKESITAIMVSSAGRCICSATGRP